MIGGSMSDRPDVRASACCNAPSGEYQGPKEVPVRDSQAGILQRQPSTQRNSCCSCFNLDIFMYADLPWNGGSHQSWDW